MAGTYKMIEIVGCSDESFAEAVRSAVREASRTVRHMDWFEVADMRGAIRDGEVTEYQVTVKIGFKIESGGESEEDEEEPAPTRAAAPAPASTKRGRGRGR
jgi:dodecin